MKIALGLLLLFLSSMSAVPPKVRSPKVSSAAYRVDSKTELQLTTSVVEYHSCYPSALTLRLLLTFKNTGTENIILYKKSSLVARHFVSRDLKALAAKKYEEKGRAEYDSGPYIPDEVDVPSDMSTSSY